MWAWWTLFVIVLGAAATFADHVATPSERLALEQRVGKRLARISTLIKTKQWRGLIHWTAWRFDSFLTGYFGSSTLPRLPIVLLISLTMNALWIIVLGSRELIYVESELWLFISVVVLIDLLLLWIPDYVSLTVSILIVRRTAKTQKILVNLITGLLVAIFLCVLTQILASLIIASTDFCANIYLRGAAGDCGKLLKAAWQFAVRQPFRLGKIFEGEYDLSSLLGLPLGAAYNTYLSFFQSTSVLFPTLLYLLMIFVLYIIAILRPCLSPLIRRVLIAERRAKGGYFKRWAAAIGILAACLTALHQAL